MANKAIIHIGAHKTGSTSIQNALYKNYDLLQHQNTFYPIDFCGLQNWEHGHHRVYYALNSLSNKSINETNNYNYIAKLKEFSRERNLILSSEEFVKLSKNDIENLLEALTGFDLHIVCYIRQQTKAIQGLYQTEIINLGLTSDFDEYFDRVKGWFDYNEILNTWKSCGIDSKNIHVVQYLNDVNKKFNAVTNFFEIVSSIIGTKLDYNYDVKLFENISYSSLITKLILYYNKTGNTKAIKILKDFGASSFKSTDSYDIITPSNIARINTYYNSSNKLIAQSYFNSQISDTFLTVNLTNIDSATYNKFEFYIEQFISLYDNLLSKSYTDFNFIKHSISNNNFLPCPPEHRNFVTPDKSDFINQGLNLMELLVNEGLQPNHSLLDLGSGIGRLAIPLTQYLSSDGCYFGVDINLSGVSWCHENITQKYPNFNFSVINAKNKHYGHKFEYGNDSMQVATLPIKSGSMFDFVSAFSLFTHLIWEDVEQYFANVGKLLKKDGIFYSTWFFINESAKKGVREGTSNFKFDISQNSTTYLIENVSYSNAIGHDETSVKKLAEMHGLYLVKPVKYSGWHLGNVGQDTLVLRKL